MAEANGIAGIRVQDLEDAETAWQCYKQTQTHLRRRQMRKRELVAGYLAGVAAERARQRDFVHPNIMRAQQLIDFADMMPEQFEVMKAQNPEAVKRLLELIS